VAPALPALLAIVGPTASGKSALALRLAREHGGEIVSCDSQQVYRGLDIGTAKPSAQERAAVPHHMIDVVEPDELFSAAEFALGARAALAAIRSRGRLPVVAGGTGLYLRALLDGLFEGPGRDADLRQRLEAAADRFGSARLHRLLSRVDPAAAARMNPRDNVRIVRALEVFRSSGRPISAQQRQQAGTRPLRGFRVQVVGLAPDRRGLRQVVEQRTRAMLERGLVDEVRGLLARGLSPALRPLQSIGYRQAVAVVQGEMTLAEAERAIVTETMRLAKRQMTWFRHQQQDVRWFETPEAAHAACARFLEPAAAPARLTE
jgi:tRNA dimethylallyltransferase